MLESLAVQNHITSTLADSADLQAIVGRRIFMDIVPLTDPATGKAPVYSMALSGV